MKITIKTLKQEAFHIEVDVERDTVRTLKEKFFQESKQDYPVERQRLIYLGKIMEDEHPLSQYNLDDKKFVVVMNKKPTTAPAEPATAAAATSAAAPASSSSAAAAAKNEASEVTVPAAAPPAAEKSKQEEEKPKEVKKPDEPQQDDLQIKIQRITEMGYSEEEARIALEICDNNPDRAVEYLLSEIATSSLGGSSGGGGGGGGGSASTGNTGLLGSTQESRLAFLRGHPTFLEMKRLLQEDPSLLPHLLQKIQSSNPELMRIISENQVEFLTLINEEADGPEGRSAVPRELETTAAAMVDSLSQADMEAIDRLKALGYPEHLVIQAYIACERNEYQAANFLVQNPDDDD
ncbi:UV excision repair protein RAD23 homolog B [Topomyia yanbarensis]|uniref:UV excision repair protein RAD23 homolog B n=1 Tax=Topomyia yanbarensis TaxID=2498891 RepID=UPI00273C2D65|nr:UV excision repair protein RAD23 homolog B [Topomyia yanbarensis]XP_058827807.1 UV excision repair protein RAD23 homolog B [Topomyia yanbarensis]